jgi:hypothetical protein
MNAKSIDRYSYVAGNPIKYNDPSGHNLNCGLQGSHAAPEDCQEADPDGDGKVPLPEPDPPAPPPTNPSESEMIDYITSFGITLGGDWTGVRLANLWEALFTHIGYKNLRFWLNGKTATLILGGTRTCDEGKTGCYGGLTQYSTVTFTATNMDNPVINMLHELGHLVDNLWGSYFTYSLKTKTFNLGGEYLAGWDGENYISLPSSGENNVRLSALISSPVGGGDAWQQRGGVENFEDWGDILPIP